MYHQVNAEPMESYQQMSFHQGGFNLNENMRHEDGTGGKKWVPHLKKGGLCGVQFSVALNLQVQIKTH